MKKMNDLTELKHIFVSSQTKLFAALAIITFMIARQPTCASSK